MELEQGANPAKIDDSVGTISSPEELNAYLNSTGGKGDYTEDNEAGAVPGDKPAGKKPTAAVPVKKDPQQQAQPKAKKAATAVVNTVDEDLEENDEADDNEEEEEEEDGDGNEEFLNVADYLNKRYNMGLNLEEVPTELSRQDEAEMVGKIFERVKVGADRMVSQYKHIDNILKDKEVADFIKAKAAGKTLKDYVQQFAATSAGSPDDVLVEKHFKAQFPEMTDTELKAMVEESREKGRLPKLAEAARKFYKTSEEQKAADELRLQQESEEAEEEDYKENVAKMAGLIRNIKEVHGVPLNDKMKNSLFKAMTYRDEEGLTAHDKALQSDAGLLRSAFGLFLLEELVKTGGSIKGNKSKKQFLETIFDDPSKLQSRTEAKAQPKFSPEIANSW